MTTPQILLPIGRLRVDGAKRNQHARTEGLTIGGKSGIHSADIAMQQAIEAPDPSLSHTLAAHVRDELGWFISHQATERPSREISIGIDGHERLSTDFTTATAATEGDPRT